MNEAIKNICQCLKEEAEAVISYTDKLASMETTEGAEGTVQTLALIRLDEVEHIQNLTLELTKLMSSDIAEAAGNEGGEESEQ